MVMAQSLFKSLKERRPAWAIDVLAPSWSRPLLERMPEVRQGLSMPIGHGQFQWGVRYRLGRALRKARYREAIVLPNSWKSALVPYWAGIPMRIGYRGEARWGLLTDSRTLNKAVLKMTVQRFVALGYPKDASLPPPIREPKLVIDTQARARALERLGIAAPEGPVLALCPGAEYGPAKRWPAAHFADVARAKLAQGWAVWLFGSDKDRAVAAEIQQALDGRGIDLTGKTQLGEAIDLMSLAEVVISNDSGLMHVAAALGRNLVALYGSSDPGFTPPLNANARVLTLNLECSPCFQRECPLGHLKCLRDLDPGTVLRAISTF